MFNESSKGLKKGRMDWSLLFAAFTLLLMGTLAIVSSTVSLPMHDRILRIHFTAIPLAAAMMEKDLNLAFAKELEDILEEDGSFDVLMTRTSDYFIPLAVRSDIANSSQADIFISIHANAHRKRTENGYEIYFMFSASGCFSKYAST